MSSPDLDAMLSQNMAAVTYLDPVAQQVADAELADALAECQPRGTRWRVPARVACVAAASVMAAVAAVVLTPGANALPAQAADLFSDLTFQALTMSRGWQCTETGDRVSRCDTADGTTALVDALDGPDGPTFVATYALPGAMGRLILRVYRNRAAEERTLAVAKSNPTAFPNLTSGPGWVLTIAEPTTR